MTIRLVSCWLQLWQKKKEVNEKKNAKKREVTTTDDLNEQLQLHAGAQLWTQMMNATPEASEG